MNVTGKLFLASILRCQSEDHCKLKAPRRAITTHRAQLTVSHQC